MEDYIHHDDIYWQRLSASNVSRCRRRLFEESPLELEPTYADAQTIASITGVHANAPARTVRQRILQHVHDSGHQMPDVGLLVDPTRKNRQCGLRPGAVGPVRVVQIGNVQE